MEIVYDVETCSEKYKQCIRKKKYGDTIEKVTKESVIFIYENKKYTVKFILEFSFDFDNGFHYTNFSDFKCSRIVNENLMNEFQRYIRRNFVTSERLSC